MRVRSLLVVASVLCCSLPVLAADDVPRQPNIVFIITDDQAIDTVAALSEWDDTQVNTPNLDRLAESGVVFGRTYNMGAWAGAVCVSSRAMLNTGRMLWHAESLDMDQHFRQERFWTQRLKNAGYETYMSGKWHVGRAPVGKLFDHVLHVRPGMPETVESAYQRPVEGKEDAWKAWDESLGGYWAGGKHWSEVLADDSIQFIKQAATADRPFFMYLAFNAPHDPRQSPRSFVEAYPTDRIELPKNWAARNPFANAIGCGSSNRDERLAPWPRTEHAIRVHRREYYALVTHTDEQIGRILSALRASKLTDNTVVIFTADHGLAVGRHGLVGKQNLYEHTVRVPLIVSGPGFEPGKQIAAPVYMQDVLPTTLELAGAATDDEVEFRSLMPLVRGERSTQYEAIYGGYHKTFQRMVIADDWKLLLFPGPGKSLLFNLADDPLELHDRSEEADMLSRKQQLFDKLRELQRQTGDELDLTSTFPELIK